MLRRRTWWLALAMVLLGIGGHPVAAADIFKHSGTVVAIDIARGQLVLDEVGPWQVRDGVAQMTRRTIVLTPVTAFAIVLRASPAGGFPGALVASPLAANAVIAGDVITVDCRHDGSRFVALKVTVAETADP
jgi:hypothetical protein